MTCSTQHSGEWRRASFVCGDLSLGPFVAASFAAASAFAMASFFSFLTFVLVAADANHLLRGAETITIATSMVRRGALS